MTFDEKLLGVITFSVVLVISVSTLLYFRVGLVENQDGLSTSSTGRRHSIAPPSMPLAESGIYYEISELVKFAEKHRGRLVSARKDRRMECGSIVSVSPIDCELCVLLVNEMLDLIKRGKTQEDVVKFATVACILFKIEDERVCENVVVEFKDELFGTLINLAYEPHEVCAFILGTECGTPLNPKLMWNVTLPDTPKPPIAPPQPPKPSSPTMRVLHISDFHFDAEYKEGTNAECGEPLCCRSDDGPPAPGVPGAGKYGDYRNCDSSATMMDNLFKHLSNTQDQFDYVVFTGDIPAHNVWDQSRSDQISALHNFQNYMNKYLPNKLVLSTVGNHESAPVNSFPPPFITGNYSEDWFYTALVPVWRQWLPKNTEATILRGGFYSFSPFPGLRYISLNMNFANSGNWWLYVNATDPAGMLQWFISELQSAEDKGEKVHVIGHIMPGACLKPFSYNYYKIINRYESTIVEQFYGHTHADYWEMLYDEETLTRPLGVAYLYESTIVEQFYGHTHADYWEMFYDEETLTRPLGVAYMPGSITTYSFLNPGYRIYEIDGNYPGSSWRVQDFTNYYFNLTNANMGGAPVWQKEYSAKEEYGMSSLFPKDWNELIYKMKTDDQLYWKFCQHQNKMAPNNCTACTGLACKAGNLCSLKTGRNGDPELCKDLYH